MISCINETVSICSDPFLPVAFLEAKGKFKPAGAGFTMDRDKICGDY